ncbi:aminotransferase [Luteitalea sp. TBR-22]|uniref:pyridoxal phosphate-dependent aminotransferase n=1 Tax=Luteitalea sp. TBR-22 TaxID=2802971 RepID=UPI001AFBF77F|nr:aminotransferase class I/II-fold pyridoxal phosphate-dependent enzyme [Luteitalea sp. TBR-22]BCS32699.1 aminotransferase [Luteitalea sp. TBR-22]
MLTPSEKASRFTESVIREMTRVALAHGAVNLSQGFPDFPAPDEVKAAAVRAVEADVNQYAVTWGAAPLRAAIGEHMQRHYDVAIEPDRQVTVCCGSTEAMIATLLATVNPGDEVIVFEPYYENYGPDAILSGATPRYVRLHEPGWTIDPDELRAAVTPRTRAIILNSPHNPTGKVFTREELQLVADLCQEHDLLAITDEIYEFIVYGEARHVPLCTLPGMAERTVTISSLSKSFSVTGWRIGWAIAPPSLAGAIRKVHDFLTVGAPAPLQDAAAFALRMPDAYFTSLAAHYDMRRQRCVAMLERCGFAPRVPDGAYYVMTDTREPLARVRAKGRGPESDDDVSVARWLAAEVGVAAVPGSSFYRPGTGGRACLRFCFCKKEETLAAAEERLFAVFV